jgi:hypothetical protein
LERICPTFFIYITSRFVFILKTAQLYIEINVYCFQHISQLFSTEPSGPAQTDRTTGVGAVLNSPAFCALAKSLVVGQLSAAPTLGEN